MSQYRIRVWETEDGLPVNSVHAIAQDPRGYLWLGLEEGVVRFDGVRMKVFSPENVEVMKSPLVQDLAVSRDGTVWIGTAAGLLAVVDDAFVRVSGGDLREDEPIRCLAPSGDDGVWIGTEGRLLRLSDRAGSAEAIEGLPESSVRALAAGRNGALWIGTQDAAWVRRAGELEPVLPTADGPLAPVSSIFQDDAGVVWLATNGDGLLAVHDGRVRRFSRDDGLPTDNVLAVTGDANGNVWAGTNGDGLVRITGDELQTLTSENGLSGDLIRALLEDRQGNLWVGTMGGGLTQIADTPFVSWSREDGLASDLVLPILATSDGAIWLGGDNGVSRLRDGRVERFGGADGVPHTVVLALAETFDGAVWAGTAGGGLARLENGAFEVLAGSHELGTDLITALLVRRDGGLLVGTHHGGLWERTGERFERLGPEGWLTSEGIFSLAEGSSGAIWVSGQRSGLFVLPPDGGAPQRVAPEVIGTAAPGLSIVEVAPGRVVIGTGGAGLVLVDGEQVQVCSKAQGLPGDVAMNVQLDGEGWLWAGTHRGVLRIRLTQLMKCFAGEVQQVTPDLFTTTDGLADTECNSGFHPDGAQSPDGRLWFPTAGGASVVDPSSLARDQASVMAVIEGVYSNGTDRSPQSTVVLPLGERSVQIRYTALDLYAPERLEFSYTLDGFDDGWVAAGQRRTAYYTNLPPGQYIFRVRAGDPWRGASVHEARVALRIPGRFYESIVFQVLSALAIGGLGFLVARRRIRGLQERQSELEGLVREREAAEAALRESEARFRDLFENANDLIFTLDPEGRITRCNREAQRAVGESSDRMIGAPFLDVVDERFRETGKTLLDRTLTCGSSEQGRLELLSASGERVVIELKTRPIVAEGVVVGLQGIGRDVGDRERLEAELRHAQKMEAVGRLAGGVAHDFNNVLAGIMGQCELLMLKRQDDELVRQRLGAVLAASERAAVMVRRLLAFSRREATVPEVLDVNEFVRQSEGMVEGFLNEDTELAVDCAAEPLWVVVDPSQLEQVLMNLVINARDAMPDGGQLRIQTRRTEAPTGRTEGDRSRWSAGCVTLEVADTGVGMDPATAEHVFEPFFTTKPAGKGTGLGLSTVYAIVQRTGGTISVRTKPEEGSCFTVELPAASPQASADSIGVEEKALPTFEGVVLVVEDTDSVRASVVEMVRSLGGDVIAADGPEAARRHVALRDDIDVLLTDVVMPGERGDQLAEELLKERPVLGVVLMTGYATQIAVSASEHGRSFELLHKPFNLATLSAALRRAQARAEDHDRSGA